MPPRIISPPVPYDGFPRPLIQWAVWIGRVDLARRVLVLDSDPNEIDMFGYTALDRFDQGDGHGDIAGMIQFLESVGGGYNVYK